MDELIKELIAGNRELLKEVGGLRKEVTDLSADYASYKESARNKTYAFVAVLVAVAVLAAVAIGNVVQLRNLSENVWCPFYKLIINSYNPNGPSAKAQGVAEYERNFDDMRRQYAALDCSDRG